MLQTLKGQIVLIAAIVALAFAAAVVLPATGFAQDIDGSLNCGANLEFRPGGGCAPVQQDTNVNDMIATIINVFSVIVGVVAVIMIIYGGFRYITSGGDSGNVGTAKNTILYAVVGLIIVALAQVIVQFVLNTTV